MPVRNHDTKLHQDFFVNLCTFAPLWHCFKVGIFTLLFLFPGFIVGQEHATCDDAMALTSSSYGPVTSTTWADSSLCNRNYPNMYFGKSPMVVWFYFVVPADTTLTFQIEPEKSADDFDFILFRADKGDFCQKEKAWQIEPIRTNFAKPTDYNKGITGLSETGTEAMVGPGFNPSYSSPVRVKKGEWYYIAVGGSVRNKGGFTLNIPIMVTKNTVAPSSMDAVPVKVPPLNLPPHHNFTIHVLDSANNPVKASVMIDGIIHGKPVKIDTTDYAFTAKKFTTLTIRANAVGHTPYQSTYLTTGDTATVTFWVRLQPLRSGQKITLKDISFGENTPYILPSSRPALDYILKFLMSNPQINIVIKGYTNDPHHKQSKKFDQELSEARAAAVQKFLTTHHIGKDRMQCIGYGSSQMLYPKPKNKRPGSG